MERIHLLGPARQDLERLVTNGVYVARPEFFALDGYTQFFKEQVERKEHTVFLPVYYSYGVDKIEKLALEVRAAAVFLIGHPVLISATERMINRLYKREINIIPVLNVSSENKMEDEYKKLLDMNVSGIGIPVIPSDKGNGDGRIRFIKKLVLSRKWRLRAHHYLYELENPGELAVYSLMFTSVIKSSLKGVISERCYIDSRHGISYSTGRGLLAKPIQEYPEPYEYYQQYVQFDLNNEMMRGFIAGRIGRDIVSDYKEELYGIRNS